MKNLKLFIFAFLIFSSCQNGVSKITGSDVTPKPPSEAELTLVVYMACDNDLESYALQNLKQMEKTEFSKINVLVLMDRSEGYDETNGNWTDTRLFEVVHDPLDTANVVSKRLDCSPLGLSSDTETELDMGSSFVLRNLLTFAKMQFPAKAYALIIWGHGTGWRYSGNDSGSRAVAVDDKTKSYMSVQALGSAVRGLDFGVIGFDTCFGGVFENIYELKDCALYTVGSAGITPGEGWNYTQLLKSLSESEFSAQEIAAAMAKSSSAQVTVFENGKLGELMNGFEVFAKNLSQTITDTTSQRAVYDSLVSCKAYSYIQFPCDLYLDVYSMAEHYSTASDLQLKNAAQKLMELVNNSGYSLQALNVELAVNFIPRLSFGTTAATHSESYIKNEAISDQCKFIKESQWWVPTRGGNSGSLLDKLFYTSF